MRFLQQDVLFSALGDLSLSVDGLTQNRFALAGGNPVSFVEWDGHMVTDDGRGNGSTNPARLASGDVGAARPVSRVCSVSPPNCSRADFENMSAEERLAWVDAVEDQYDPEYNIQGSCY
jgi:hypothetical protein